MDYSPGSIGHETLRTNKEVLFTLRQKRNVKTLSFTMKQGKYLF